MTQDSLPDAKHRMHSIETSPFNASAEWVASLPTSYVAERYRQKCGVNILASFGNVGEIHLYECEATGMRFWRPTSVAGDEKFYRILSAAWPDYYRTERWEYSHVRKILRPNMRVLEVGSGRGYFLKSIEDSVADASGLELNQEAISQKVTTFDVHPKVIEDVAECQPASFDVVCSFQVIEHVSDPARFIKSCLVSLKPGGLLILSTPNHNSPFLRAYGDAFDLPPHHLNHFTDDVYRKIARQYGLDVRCIRLEPRVFEFEPVTEHTRKDLLYRLAKRGIGSLMNRCYAYIAEPGPNILAVLMKK
jgi:SAM-dependent methyltransferase